MKIETNYLMSLLQETLHVPKWHGMDLLEFTKRMKKDVNAKIVKR